MSNAQWISPRGKIIDVGTNHIAMIIKHPNKFGYTKQNIEKFYKKYKEPIGLEGKAREEIIKDVVKSGWIRTRKYDRQGYWSVTINTLDKRTKDVLWQWANKTKKDKFMSVQIVPIGKGNVISNYDVDDISNDILVKESYENMITLEDANIEDLPDIILKDFKEWKDDQS